MPSRRRQKVSPMCAMMSRRPLWPPWPPPCFKRTVPTGRSSSSCATRISSGATLKKSLKLAHRQPLRFMYVVGFKQHYVLLADVDAARSRRSTCGSRGTPRRGAARAGPRTRSPRCGAVTWCSRSRIAETDDDASTVIQPSGAPTANSIARVEKKQGPPEPAAPPVDDGRLLLRVFLRRFLLGVRLRGLAPSWPHRAAAGRGAGGRAAPHLPRAPPRLLPLPPRGSGSSARGL